TALTDQLAQQLFPQDVPARVADLPQTLPQTDAAIAIVGLGCRFPGGADNPDAFWQLLQRGGDAVCEIPAERSPAVDSYDGRPHAAGKMYTRHGAFLDAVDRFDASFFGIAPREAVSMDPQQRLLLEVAWEALEHAGIAADALAGSATGVYIGMAGND